MGGDVEGFTQKYDCGKHNVWTFLGGSWIRLGPGENAFSHLLAPTSEGGGVVEGELGQPVHHVLHLDRHDTAQVGQVIIPV